MSDCECPSRGESPHAMDCPADRPAPAVSPDRERLREDDEHECEHHSWAGLMALLDEHWPEDIFPTRWPDDITRDAGARIASLIRWADRLLAERDELARKVAAVQELEAKWYREGTAPVQALHLRHALGGTP